VAIIYRPPTSSPKHGVSIGQFCTEFSELLDELLALPGQLVVCGDFNCQSTVACLTWSWWSRTALRYELTSLHINTVTRWIC